MKKRFDITSQEKIIWLIVCFAAVLWIWNLGADSLWLDEAVSVERAHYDFKELVDTVYGVGTNPPLHYILLYGWVRVFGDSEFSVRLPSAICAVVSLFLTYRIGSLLYDKKIGSLAAVLVALSSYQLYFAQEARAYALFGMLSLFSVYFFYRLLTETGWRLLAGYVVSTGLMLYTHPYAPFVVVMQNICVVILWLTKSADMQLNWRRWIPMQVVVCAAFLPWLLKMVGKVGRMQRRPLGLQEPFWVDVPGVFKAYAGDNALLGLYMMLLACVAIFAVVRLRRAGKGTLYDFVGTSRFRDTLLIVLWIVVPVLIPFGISKVSAPIFASRYTVASSYAFYILTAVGISYMPGKGVRRAAALILVTGLTATLVQHSIRTDREPWRKVAEYVEAGAEAGEPVVFYARFCRIPYDYYAQRRDLWLLDIPSDGRAHRIEDEDLQQLSEKLKGHPSVWAIFSHSWRNEEKITDYFKRSYDIAERADYFGVKVYLFIAKDNGN